MFVFACVGGSCGSPQIVTLGSDGQPGDLFGQGMALSGSCSRCLVLLQLMKLRWFVSAQATAPSLQLGLQGVTTESVPFTLAHVALASAGHSTSSSSQQEWRVTCLVTRELPLW